MSCGGLNDDAPRRRFKITIRTIRAMANKRTPTTAPMIAVELPPPVSLPFCASTVGVGIGLSHNVPVNSGVQEQL